MGPESKHEYGRLGGDTEMANGQYGLLLIRFPQLTRREQGNPSMV